MRLVSLLDEIDNNTLLLPDFQRDYVWIKKEEKIIDFISSVLSQLPIGNIISFGSDSTVFASKDIGFNTLSNHSQSSSQVKFLLDGQQRVTTLAIVFSDRIFRKIKTGQKQLDDLIQKNKIKNRYFLKLPKYDDKTFSNDFFGFNNLFFPEDLNPLNVNFCSNDIRDLIIQKSFTFATNDPKKSWFYPTDIDYSNQRDFVAPTVESASNEGLIPLFYLSDQQPLIKSILNKMATKREDFIKTLYTLNNITDLKTYLNDNQQIYNIHIGNKDDDDIFNEFETKLRKNSSTWVDKMFDYLCNCVNSLQLEEKNVSGQNPPRAVNIFQALNEGGVKLSTYDLIIAIAANSNKGSLFDSKIREIIKTSYDSNNSLLFRNIIPNSWNSNSSWSSDEYMLTINNNDEINTKIINQFLNLLCFVSNYSNNQKKGNPNNYKMPNSPLSNLPTDLCKAYAQLKLSADQITFFSQHCMKSIIDALLILQFKCGVYSIEQIDYDFILFPLSYMMYLFESKSLPKNYSISKLINYFIAFYFFCLFSGEYMLDQSSRVMRHVEWVHNLLMCNQLPYPFKPDSNTKIIPALDDNVILNKANYNDLHTLLFEDNNIPKKAVRNSIMQFILQKNPQDFITQSPHTDGLHAWDKTISFQLHHIIPLASATNLGNSSKSIRGSIGAINSPLNLAPISKEANKIISSWILSQYQASLNNTVTTDYIIPTNFKNFQYKKNDPNSETNLKKVLEERYNAIKGEIIAHIRKLL